jgi:hypothetical protein
VVRISSLPAQFRAASARILGDDVRGIYLSIDPRRGVLRIVVGGEDANGDGGTAAIGGSVDFHKSPAVIFEKLPPEIWPAVSPSVVADRLSQGIKRAYDPHNVLNPGILGDLM